MIQPSISQSYIIRHFTRVELNFEILLVCDQGYGLSRVAYNVHYLPEMFTLKRTFSTIKAQT